MAAEDVGVDSFAHRMLLYHVSWETYESLLADHCDRSAPRFAYDHGVLEIVRPTRRHEELHISLSAVVTTVAEELDIDFRPMGSTTYWRQARQQGFEADSSFYVQNHRFVRDREEVDPKVDPPPDLVIEAESNDLCLNKLPIFAGFGVPEVWRSNDERVMILLLEGDTYRESATSRAMPVLTSVILTDFQRQHRALRRLEWLRAVRAWIREQTEARGASR
jgi:Uma2 family endonuclease